MAKDRMLSDEILLGLIKKNSGGGGTTDYEDLDNLPQIGGVELKGNKSLADLGIASEADLEEKQNALTAGSHIDISNNEVSVNRYAIPAGDIVYRVVTVNATTAYVDKYTSSGTFVERINITVNVYQTQDVESKIRFYREFDGWVITLLANSKEHNAGYSYSARSSGVESQNDFTFTLPQVEDDNDLIIRSELATKQGTLTAGDYISIANDEISVNREIPSVIAEYEIKTEPMVSGQAFISITKTVNGEVVLTQKYGSSTAGINQGINFDENIYVDYSKTTDWSWTYKLRNASVDHATDYTQSWNYSSTVDYTEEFIVTDHSGDKLVIKSEMDTALSGKQNTLTFDDTPTDGSNNPVKSNGIYDALATKANTDMVAADFSAGTSYTAGNYCVQDGKLYKFKNNHSGAWSSADVDEVKITGELSALRSGLINQTARNRSNITNRLTNLATAVSEQNLEKYGYKIGDYFVGASGYTYILADMDTYYGGYNNNAIVNTHHISLVVKTGASSKWAETNDTSGGYKTSTLHSFLSSTVLDNIKSDMIALFGGSTGLEHLVSHNLLWTTATSGAWAWSDNAEYISALSEPQVYGTNVWAIDGYQTGEAWKWLEVFHKFNFCEILGNIWWWLRSIYSASDACLARSVGSANFDCASYSTGAVGLIIFH